MNLSSMGNGLAASAKNFITAAAKNPSFRGSFSQTAGSSYADAKENGESDATATAYALINGALSAGVEITGGAETMPSFDKANKYLLQILKTSIEEGNEEAVQNAIETVTQQVLYKKKPNYTAEEFLKESAESRGMGAAMSGVMGAARYGGAKIADTAANTAETYRIGKEINQDTDLIKANIEEGLKQGKATDAYKTAKKNESFLADTSKKPSNMTSGKQFKANIQAEADLNAQKGLYKRQTGFDVLNKPSPGSFEGYTDSEKNSIVINDNYNHQADILAHEGGHAVESAAPEAASTAVSRTIEILNKPKYKAQFETRKNALRRAYAKNGIEVSEAEIERDVAVDMRREGLLYKSAKEQAANISGKSRFGTDAAKRAEAAIKTAFGRTHTNENADITVSALDADRIRRAWAKADADAAKAADGNTDGAVNEYNRNEIGIFSESDRNGNALFTTETVHTPEQQKIIDEYENAVDKDLLDFVNYAKEHNDDNRTAVILSDVTDRAAKDIQAKTGIDVTGFKHSIKANAVRHIEERHGENGIADKMMTDEDISRIGYVLKNYDSVEKLSDTSKEFRDKSQRPATMIRFSKRIDGTYYVVEAVPESRAKRLQVVTAYKNKAVERQALIMQNKLPQFHVQDVVTDTASFNDIIPQPTANVKRKFNPNGIDFSLDTKTPTSRLNDIADLNDGKLSDLFKNTMHKEHYPEEFHAAADAREDKFRYKARSNKADYEAAQARIGQNGAEAVLNSLLNRSNTPLCLQGAEFANLSVLLCKTCRGQLFVHICTKSKKATCKGSVSSSGFQWEIITPTEILKWNPTS